MATGTVICRGPRKASSVGANIEWRTEPVAEAGDGRFTFDPAGPVEVVGGFDADPVEEPNPELEDCNRVLTTSNGHVKMAPIVPPTPPATKWIMVSVVDPILFLSLSGHEH